MGNHEMIAYLKALASRLLRGGPGPLLPPQDDPEAGVRVPRNHGPGGRGSTIAVPEPPEYQFVRAAGIAERRTRERTVVGPPRTQICVTRGHDVDPDRTSGNAEAS